VDELPKSIKVNFDEEGKSFLNTLSVTVVGLFLSGQG
jgi:hypothetical protein